VFEYEDTALKKSGFTLVEVILASMIGAFVAVVAVGTLKAISDSAELVEQGSETAGELRFASKMVSTDLANLYRDEGSKNPMFVGLVEETEGESASRLVFRTVCRSKARVEQPEGDVYEVEYYLLKETERSALFRRLWPNPDREAEPGGVLTVISEGIDIFEVRFFDGEQWYLEWPEQMRRLPDMVQVNMAAQLANRRDVLAETFIANLVRSEGGEEGSSEESESEESSEAGDEEPSEERDEATAEERS